MLGGQGRSVRRSNGSDSGRRVGGSYLQAGGVGLRRPNRALKLKEGKALPWRCSSAAMVILRFVALRLASNGPGTWLP